MPRPYSRVNKNICVEYPHGAGGVFLSTVLACCTMNLPWQGSKVNFHQNPYVIGEGHWLEPANNIISIDDPGAKYNFWMNYFKKRVVYELVRSRYQGQRWIRCPYENLSLKQDGIWLLNQCKFVIDYSSQQPWKLSWITMLTDPGTCWQTIVEFLQTNNQPNHWNIDQWISAVGVYRKTLATPTINVHHSKWQIWATALLQSQNIVPDFDVVDNFRKPVFVSWLDKHNDSLIELTNTRLLYKVDQ